MQTTTTTAPLPYDPRTDNDPLGALNELARLHDGLRDDTLEHNMHLAWGWARRVVNHFTPKPVTVAEAHEAWAAARNMGATCEYAAAHNMPEVLHIDVPTSRVDAAVNAAEAVLADTYDQRDPIVVLVEHLGVPVIPNQKERTR